MWQYQNTDELYHHGVLGQRWGFRRYQNADGTLTPAGRRKAGKLAKQYAKVTGKKLVVKKKSVFGNENKPISQMSDQEIRDKINRINLENRYASLLKSTERTASPATKKKGKTFVQKSIKSIGSGVQGGISDGTKEIVKRMLVNAFNGVSNSSNKSSNKSKKKYTSNDYDDATRTTAKELLGAAKEISNEYKDYYSKHPKNRNGWGSTSDAKRNLRKTKRRIVDKF